MGIKLPDGYIETSKGVYERRDMATNRKKINTSPKREPQAAKPKSSSGHEPLAKVEGKEGDSSRLLVLIESVRKRLLDTDNLYGGAKYFCDFLRYIKTLPEDTEAIIELRVTQRKPRTNEEEKTVIEVWNRGV